MSVGPPAPMDLVIDASIGVKWFVPEPGSEGAMVLLDARFRRQVPALFFTEVAQTLWKKVRLRGELSDEEGREALRNLLVMPLEVTPTEALLEGALEIALATGRTVYDSVYLALAESIGCRFVTADDRLRHALRGGILTDRVLVIADLGRLIAGAESH